VRVFITGALGFIGRALSDAYRAEGAEVRGVDVRADEGRGVMAGDVGRPGDWQRHAAACELFVHTAARVTFAPGPAGFWRVNVAGTRRALDAAVAGGAARFVHFSSVTVFGLDYPDGADETFPVRPTGVPYVDMKVAAEQVVLQAHAAGEAPCTIVRPGDVYGPGSRPWTALAVEQLRGRRMALPAFGRGEISPVFVDNLVDGVKRAAVTDAGVGHVFTLTDGRAVPTREFFGHYARMLGRRGVPAAPTALVAALAGAVSATERMRGREPEVTPAAVGYLARRGTYSIAKARRVLGYEPAVDLDEGMRRTEAWLRTRGLLG
jgi:nucleoside-diphosphate-sugar epimerase